MESPLESKHHLRFIILQIQASVYSDSQSGMHPLRPCGSRRPHAWPVQPSTPEREPLPGRVAPTPTALSQRHDLEEVGHVLTLLQAWSPEWEG